jgi:hypothetical protein
VGELSAEVCCGPVSGIEPVNAPRVCLGISFPAFFQIVGHKQTLNEKFSVSVWLGGRRCHNSLLSSFANRNLAVSGVFGIPRCDGTGSHPSPFPRISRNIILVLLFALLLIF